MNDNQNLTEIPQTPKKPLPFHRIYNTHLGQEVARITTTKSIFRHQLLKPIMKVSAGVLLLALILFFLITKAGYKNELFIMITPIIMIGALPIIMDKQDMKLRGILIIGFFAVNLMGLLLMSTLNKMGVTYATTLYFSCAVSLFVGVIFFYYTYRKRLWEASQKQAENFHKQYANILTKLLKAFDENMTYKPDNGISEQAVIDSQLFYRERKIYESYNLVEHQGQPQFSFAHIHLQPMEKKSLKDIQDNSIIPIDGIFIIVDIEKELQGITVIKPKNMVSSIAKDLIGKIWKNDDDKTLVDIEHDEFNKHFTVDSDYPLESMEILTPDFVERLMALQKKILPVFARGGKSQAYSSMVNFSISIQNKKMYIYPNFLKNKRTLTPVKIFASTVSKNAETIRKRLKDDYEYLQKIVEIVKELRIK